MCVLDLGCVAVCPEEDVTLAVILSRQTAPVTGHSCTGQGEFLVSASQQPQQLPGCFPTFLL